MKTSPLPVKGYKISAYTQCFWAARDLYCVYPAVTRGLGFSSLIRSTSPIQSPLMARKGMLKTYSNLNSNGF
jgi:hypothetical protein